MGSRMICLGGKLSARSGVTICILLMCLRGMRSIQSLFRCGYSVLHVEKEKEKESHWGAGSSDPWTCMDNLILAD